MLGTAEKYTQNIVITDLKIFIPRFPKIFPPSDDRRPETPGTARLTCHIDPVYPQIHPENTRNRAKVIRDRRPDADPRTGSSHHFPCTDPDPCSPPHPGPCGPKSRPRSRIPAFALSRPRALRYTSRTEGSKAQRLTIPSQTIDTGAPGRGTFRPAAPRPMTRVIA